MAVTARHRSRKRIDPIRPRFLALALPGRLLFLPAAVVVTQASGRLSQQQTTLGNSQGLALPAKNDHSSKFCGLAFRLRLDPFYTPFATYVLGFAHYMLEQYPQALALLRDYVAEAPNH